VNTGKLVLFVHRRRTFRGELTSLGYLLVNLTKEKNSWSGHDKLWGPYTQGGVYLKVVRLLCSRVGLSCVVLGLLGCAWIYIWWGKRFVQLPRADSRLLERDKLITWSY
jgi:hypothetical protein